MSLTVEEAQDIIDHYRPPPPPSLLEWATQHRAIDGIPFSLQRYPCMEAIYNDESNHIVVVKPNQVGASEWLLNVCLHTMDVGAKYFGIEHIKKALNVGYIFPTWEHLKDFSKERIRKVAGETPYLADLLGPVSFGPLKRESDLGLYFIRNCAWYLRGAHNPDTQLASFPVDLLVLDEYDLISPRASSLAEKRLRASPLRWRRYVSKPTLPGFGIDGLYRTSDQRQWQLQCETCGDWQPLDFWANVALVIQPGKIEYHTDWSKRDKADLEQSQFEFVCRRCADPLDRLGPGRWVAQTPGALVRGYAIPGLIAPFVPLLDVVKGSLQQEPDLLLEWYRADLGIAKSPEGGQLSIDDLEACKGEYLMINHGRRCTMGIDVGVKLNCRVGCYQQGEWQTLWIGEVDEFDELDDLMRRYDVRAAVIDAEPETRMARDFCQRWKGRVWMADYIHPVTPPKAVFDWKEADEEEARVKIARTEAMDRVASAYLERRESLPTDARFVPGFYAHMCAPVRVATMKKKSDGTRYNTYIYMESGPDHYFHASVYERAAREQLPVISIPTQGVSTDTAY